MSGRETLERIADMLEKVEEEGDPEGGYCRSLARLIRSDLGLTIPLRAPETN